MTENVKQRVIDETNYIINTNKTVREISEYFGVSKSTVHDDLHKKLKKINLELYKKVEGILNYHFLIKHIRGGYATMLKYTKNK